MEFSKEEIMSFVGGLGVSRILAGRFRKQVLGHFPGARLFLKASDRELAASGVRIPAGASLEATVGRIGKAGKTYVVTASVEAGGTCAIEKDGVAGPTLSAGANQTAKVASTSDFMDMAFRAADAAATLSGIRMNLGITVNFR